MEAADKETEYWHKEADKIIRYWESSREMGDTVQDGAQRWNLFAANTLTIGAMLYGRVPEVSVSRRFADSKDDVARVAGVTLERMLNADIQGDDDPYALALEQTLWDRLVPGLGVARVRYEMEEATEPHSEEEEEAENETSGKEGSGGRRDNRQDAYPGDALGDGDDGRGGGTQEGQPTKAYECVHVEYVHWRDFGWSAGSRTWHDVRWLRFRHRVSKATGEKQFGAKVWATVPMTPRDPSKKAEEAGNDPWARAEVWEIWSREDRKVYWWVRGAPAVLRIDDDPYGLKGFWPCPRPMFGATTTDKLVPIPDFRFAEDQYRAIDKVVTRLGKLTDALKVRGVYDAKQIAAKRTLLEAGDNEMIPVENWAMWGESGGMAGAFQMFPIQDVVNTVVALEERLDRMKAQLDEVTGMADVLRGQGDAGATATQDRIKTKFASARLQRLQDDFARFAGECQQLKAEIIGNREVFSAQTILEQSNIRATPDADKASAAIALIQSGKKDYRVKVAPENLALADFAQLKSDRMEVLGAMAQFFTAVAPLMQAVPASSEFFLGLLQWMVAGIKGGAEVEGMLDKAIEQARAFGQRPQQQQAPDPKLQAQAMKGQQDMQKAQQEHQNRLQEIQAEVQGDVIREAAQAKYGVQEAQARTVLHQMVKPQNPNGGVKP
jgi:hypothetical protein